MAEENQERDVEAVAALAGRLGVGLEIVADPTGHGFLATLPEAQADIFVEALQTTPAELKTKLLESGMGNYFLEALQENLITPSQGEALAVVLAGRGFKIHSGAGTPFSSIPPAIEEVKTQSNPYRAFEGFIREELLGKEIDKISEELGLSPEDKESFRSKFLKSYNDDVENFVKDGQVSDHLQELIRYFLINCEEGLAPSEHVEAFAFALQDKTMRWPEIDWLQREKSPAEYMGYLIKHTLSDYYAGEVAKDLQNDIIAPFDEVRNVLKVQMQEIMGSSYLGPEDESLKDMVKNGELNNKLLASLIKDFKERKDEIETLAIVGSVLHEEVMSGFNKMVDAQAKKDETHVKNVQKINTIMDNLAYHIIDYARDCGALQNKEKNDLNPALVKTLKDAWTLNEEQVRTIGKILSKQRNEEKIEGVAAALKEAGIDLDERFSGQQRKSAGGNPPAAGQGNGQPSDAKGKDAGDKEAKGLKKFMTTRNVVGAAIVATLALVTALVMKNKGKDAQPAAGMGRG